MDICKKRASSELKENVTVVTTESAVNVELEAYIVVILGPGSAEESYFSWAGFAEDADYGGMVRRVAIYGALKSVDFRLSVALSYIVRAIARGGKGALGESLLR